MKKLLVGFLSVLLLLAGCSSDSATDVDAKIHNTVRKYLQEVDKELEAAEEKEPQTVLQQAKNKIHTVEGNVSTRIYKRWQSVAEKLYEENPEIDIRLAELSDHRYVYNEESPAYVVVKQESTQIPKSIQIPKGSVTLRYGWQEPDTLIGQGRLFITTDANNRSLLELHFSFWDPSEIDKITEEKVIASSSLAIQLVNGASPKEAEEILAKFVSRKDENVVQDEWVYNGQIQPDKEGIKCSVKICRIPD